MSTTSDRLLTVSIVTPSYNMAQFLEEAVRSVISQAYPELEYVVMDGGSTDSTIEILERYQPAVRYVSGPDKGAADAINAGFRASRGEIVGWLNADDAYLPGAVKTAADYLAGHPDVDVVYGQAHWVDENGRVLRPYPVKPFDPLLLKSECFICQPACFFRRSALEAAGMLDDTLQFAFDYDLWIRLARNSTFALIPEYLAVSRMHRSNKTLGQRRQVMRESMSVLKRHYAYIPFQSVHGYCSYLLDRRDQFYEPLRPSLGKYLLTLPVGTYHNLAAAPRFWREWLSVMTPAAAARRWHESRLSRFFRSVLF